jgi:hypothetical protein
LELVDIHRWDINKTRILCAGGGPPVGRAYSFGFTSGDGSDESFSLETNMGKNRCAVNRRNPAKSLTYRANRPISRSAFR